MWNLGKAAMIALLLLNEVHDSPKSCPGRLRGFPTRKSAWLMLCKTLSDSCFTGSVPIQLCLLLTDGVSLWVVKLFDQSSSSGRYPRQESFPAASITIAFFTFILITNSSSPSFLHPFPLKPTHLRTRLSSPPSAPRSSLHCC